MSNVKDWNELIKNEDQLNGLNKEELIGCVKTLLDHINELEKNCEKLHKQINELSHEMVLLMNGF